MNYQSRFSKAILFLSLGILFLIALYPYIVMTGKIIFPLPEGTFSLKYITKVFASGSSSTFVAMKNTVIISLATGMTSLLMALPLSWILTRTNMLYNNKLRSLFCLPYAIPPYIGAMAWIYLANPKTGILNTFFGEGFFDIYTHVGLIWVLSTFFYTFVLLSLLGALDRMDPSLEEAARLSGAGPLRVFWDITLPIIRPAMLSGVLLVVLATSASFGVPAMIGNPANIYLMTTKIYTYQKMGSMSGVYTAGSLAILLLGFAVITLYVNQRLLRGHFKTVGGKTSRPGLVDLGRFRMPLFILLVLSFIIVFIMPIFGILVTALSKVQGTLSLSNLGLQNFSKVFFEVDETPRALANSLKLAVSAATIACLWGVIIAYFKHRSRFKASKIADLLVSLPYATPGTVLAFAFILAFGQSIWGTGISLYGTLTLIVLAYIAKYLNFALRTTSDGIAQIDPVLEEAARVSGASWWKSMTSIWIPLLKPVLISSWFLVFMPCFSELTMTILLSGPGLETIGTLIFQLQEYGDASGGGAAVLALLTVFMVGIINLIVKIVSKGKYGL